MSNCPSCGGVIGRDCFNPEECAYITQQQQYENPKQHFCNECAVKQVIIDKQAEQIESVKKLLCKHHGGLPDDDIYAGVDQLINEIIIQSENCRYKGELENEVTRLRKCQDFWAEEHNTLVDMRTENRKQAEQIERSKKAIKDVRSYLNSIDCYGEIMVTIEQALESEENNGDNQRGN